MQIGYYALIESEPFETRFALLHPYLTSFTGQEPDPGEMAEFLEAVQTLLRRRPGQ